MSNLSAISRILNDAETYLREHNADAENVRWDRFKAELAAMVYRHGVWNVASALREVAERTADNEPDYPDWRIAAEVMQKACDQLDLPYQEDRCKPSGND